MLRRLRMFTIALGCCSMLVTACSSETPPGDDDDDDTPEKLRDDIPDPPPGGVQLVSPTFTVPAGDEQFVCMRVSLGIAQEMFVQSANVFQMNGGHHTLVFYSGNSAGVDPTPHECDGFEMTDVRLVGTGTADGKGLAMPDGIVLQVPANQEIWIQSHYLNATDNELIAQDVINLNLIPADDVQQIASSFAHTDLTFSLPPLQKTTRTMECTIPQDMTVPWILPHMHEFGSEFKLELLRDSELMWDWEGEWFEQARDDFDVHEFEPHMQLLAGDKLRTTCTWNNTEDNALLFPREMCVTFFPFYPGDGRLLACDEFDSVFEP